MTISKKVCLLGDFAVGKTSLVRRFVYDRFDDRYISTIGVKVSRKSLVVPRPGGPIDLVLMLWDLAGSEEFSTMRASYLRGAAGAILVCDVTRPETVEALIAYREQIEAASAGTAVVIAANKIDRLPPGARCARADAIAEALGAPLVYTSARDSVGVEALFRELGARVSG
ncbi:MAG: GTP-binding protein [Anaerolineae bacterium]|nr:GTP-binding protein [Anaerolineae bacterium]